MKYTITIHGYIDAEAKVAERGREREREIVCKKKRLVCANFVIVFAVAVWLCHNSYRCHWKQYSTAKDQFDVHILYGFAELKCVGEGGKMTKNGVKNVFSR